jgi:hypothetical protein
MKKKMYVDRRRSEEEESEATGWLKIWYLAFLL